MKLLWLGVWEHNTKSARVLWQKKDLPPFDSHRVSVGTRCTDRYFNAA